MNIQINFKQYIVLAAMIAAGTHTQAQKAENDVQGLATDENYNNTTIVYKREAANDLEVLAKMGGGFGMGDVVRVTVAPPKPAPTESLNTAPKVVSASKPALPTVQTTATKPQEIVAKPIEAPVQKTVAPATTPAALVVTNVISQPAPETKQVVAKTATAPKQTAAVKLTPAPKKATTTTGSKAQKKGTKKQYHAKRHNGFKLFDHKMNIKNLFGKSRVRCPKF